MTPDSAEVVIVNTCAFLTEASEESINRILDLSDFKSMGNCEKLVATGCLTQRYQDSLAEQIPELDGLLGSNGFEQIQELVRSMYEDSGHLQTFLKQKPHYKQFEEQSRIQTTPYHYTYLKVAEGCSNMCSFCNIPALRGNFSSRTVNSIITEISNLIEKGVKEINLISQDISSYGKDFNDNTGLATLLKNISEIEGDFWIRLFYCYPNSFTDETMEVIADDNRFCRYLDLPFQLGEDTGVVVEAKVVERDTQWQLLRAEFSGGQLWVRDGGDAIGSLIRIRILARDVSLALEAHKDSSIVNLLQAEVIEVRDDTSIAMALVRLRIDTTVIIARVSRRSVDHLDIHMGRQMWLQIKSVAILR